MRERRTHTRVKTSRPAVYLPDVYPRPKVCSTVDLSLGGTRLETPYSLEPGERLQISIAIGPRVVKCRGKVVHVLRGADQRLMVGVRFEDLSKQHRGYLREYILESQGTARQGNQGPPSLTANPLVTIRHFRLPFY